MYLDQYRWHQTGCYKNAKFLRILTDFSRKEQKLRLSHSLAAGHKSGACTYSVWTLSTQLRMHIVAGAWVELHEAPLRNPVNGLIFTPVNIGNTLLCCSNVPAASPQSDQVMQMMMLAIMLIMLTHESR